MVASCTNYRRRGDEKAQRTNHSPESAAGGAADDVAAGRAALGRAEACGVSQSAKAMANCAAVIVVIEPMAAALLIDRQCYLCRQPMLYSFSAPPG